MNTLIALVVLFLIGTTFFSIIATIYRFFISSIGGSSSPSKSSQRQTYQREDLTNKDSVSLKDAFLTNNTTRQKFASNANGSSQKRNQQAQAKQLSSRMQQDAARRRAETLQQNTKRKPEPVRSSTAPKSTLFNENDVKKNKSQTLFDRDDLTSLTPIDKVTSTRKSSYQTEIKANKRHLQNDYVKGIIYKEILDKPVSLRNNK
ncbi:MAG: hypothetical protein ABS911_00380 [Carnobacterium sp.]|uniref:hypothetical protein n=1 Tax=Carnobacterium sp. TaxID=48221 RepID=UPI00331623FB